MARPKKIEKKSAKKDKNVKVAKKEKAGKSAMSATLSMRGVTVNSYTGMLKACQDGILRLSARQPRSKLRNIYDIPVVQIAGIEAAGVTGKSMKDLIGSDITVYMKPVYRLIKREIGEVGKFQALEGFSVIKDPDKDNLFMVCNDMAELILDDPNDTSTWKRKRSEEEAKLGPVKTYVWKKKEDVDADDDEDGEEEKPKKKTKKEKDEPKKKKKVVEEEDEDEDDSDEDEDDSDDSDEDEDEDDSDEDEDENDSDEDDSPQYSQEDIEEMSKKELKALIKENDMDIDASDYDSLDDLKEAICDELGLGWDK